MNAAQRDRAWGRFFGKRGLRLDDVERPPLPADRVATWAERNARLPAECRRVGGFTFDFAARDYAREQIATAHPEY